MREPIEHSLLLAQMELFRNLGAGFRGRAAHFGASDLITIILVVASLALGMYLLSRMMHRQEVPQRSNSPRVLFRELCLAHGLDRSSRRLLRQIGRYQRLDHLGRLFVEPERFDPGNLSPKLRKKQELLRALREQLFGELTADGLERSTKSAKKSSQKSEVKRPAGRTSISPVVSSDGALSADTPTNV